MWLFDTLLAQRAGIEAEFCEPLEWERLDHRHASRISVYRLGSIEDPLETLEEIQDWAIERLLRLKTVIGPLASASTMTGHLPSSLADPAATY